MSKVLKNIFFVVMSVLIVSICIYIDSAKADDGATGGINEYGDLIFSPTLMARCNIKDYRLEQDCIKRLAYDYRTNAAQFEMFRDFNEEQETILEEYRSAYLDFAVSKVVDSGNQESDLNKKICVDDSGEECGNVGSDTLTNIRFHNNISANTTKLLIDINKLRNSGTTINNIENILNVIVVGTEVDENDTSLAGPPQ